MILFAGIMTIPKKEGIKVSKAFRSLTSYTRIGFIPIPSLFQSLLRLSKRPSDTSTKRRTKLKDEVLFQNIRWYKNDFEFYNNSTKLNSSISLGILGLEASLVKRTGFSSTTYQTSLSQQRWKLWRIVRRYQ